MMELAPDIVVDPKIRFGKPIIKNTRVTVEEVLGMLEAGMDYEEIEREYSLNRASILAAVTYASSFLKGEEIKLAKPTRVRAWV